MNPQPYAPKAYALARLRYYSLMKPRTFGHYKEAFGVCYKSINTIAFIMSRHFYLKRFKINRASSRNSNISNTEASLENCT